MSGVASCSLSRLPLIKLPKTERLVGWFGRMLKTASREWNRSLATNGQKCTREDYFACSCDIISTSLRRLSSISILRYSEKPLVSVSSLETSASQISAASNLTSHLQRVEGRVRKQSIRRRNRKSQEGRRNEQTTFRRSIALVEIERRSAKATAARPNFFGARSATNGCMEELKLAD